MTVDVPTNGLVVFDIDGTVADCRHRLGLITKDVPDWEAFFAASGSDEPLLVGLALATDHILHGDLMWLTGRPERFRDQTVRWLRDQGLPDQNLSMRPNDDVRPVAEFKVERIEQIAAERSIALIVDDDDLVVAALREAGWPVQHAQWMQA